MQSFHSIVPLFVLCRTWPYFGYSTKSTSDVRQPGAGLSTPRTLAVVEAGVNARGRNTEWKEVGGATANAIISNQSIPPWGTIWSDDWGKRRDRSRRDGPSSEQSTSFLIGSDDLRVYLKPDRTIARISGLLSPTACGFALPVSTSTKVGKTRTVSGLSIGILLLGLQVHLSCVAHAQMQSQTGQNSVPRPEVGHDYIQLLNETVSPGSGSVNVQIAIPQPPGKALTLPFSLSYNSGSVWQVDNGSNGQFQVKPVPSTYVQSTNGWEYSIPMITYKSAEVEYLPPPPTNQYVPGTVPDADPNGTTCTWSTSYVFYDPSGQRHPLELGSLNIYPARIAECPRCCGWEGTRTSRKRVS